MKPEIDPPGKLKVLMFAIMISLFLLTFFILDKGRLTMNTDIATYNDCPSCSVFDVRQANTDDYECVPLKVEPETPICIYPLEKDIYVSQSLFHDGIWEPIQVKWMQEVLGRNPDMGLIDAGANLGVFTLTAAAMGHNVLSLEPGIENARRLHKSIKLGHLEERITLVTNVVSNKRALYKLNTDDLNQSGLKAGEISTTDVMNATEEDIYVSSITMNDLVPLCKFKIAFLKMDIEGSEPRALAAADVLFDVIDIQYVLMEWFHIQASLKAEDAEDAILAKQMMAFLEERHYFPETILHVPLNLSEYSTWPADIIWRKVLSN